MRWLAILSVLALLAPQDKKDDKPQEKKPCDLAKIEDGQYCAKCKKVLYKDAVFKIDLFDKEGNCKECQSKPEKVKVCVKQWIPHCNMCDKAHDVCCCKSKQCCKVETNYSLVTFRCPECKVEARSEEGVMHTTKHAEVKLVKVCERDNTYPHGGELPVKKEK